MKKSAWKNKIKKRCQDAGTYRPEFEEPISTLADILEKRDAINEEYKRLGSKPVIVYTNKGGASNPTKNPLLILWSDLNQQALAYWRDLGLTPAGLKKLNEDALKGQNKSALARVLEDLDKI